MNYIKERSRGKGYLIFTPNDSDKDEVNHTITCCHCNHSFTIIPGSGRERGWCHECSQSTCGATACAPSLNGCAPFPKKLEAYEKLAAGLGEFDGISKNGLWVKTMLEVKLRG